MELFGDVPSIITDLEQQRQFYALPYAAVLAWLQSDDLKVHSESCVLFLLTAWVNSKEHPACSPDELKLLAHSLRVAHLSPTYLHYVLPDLKWFQENCSEDAIFLRASFVKSCHIDAPCSLLEGPAAWVADKRKGTAMPVSIDIEWHLVAADFLQLDEAPPRRNFFCPQAKAYLNGVFYTLVVQKFAKAEGGPVTLAVFLHVDVDTMRSVMCFWDTKRQPCFFKAKLHAAGSVLSRLFNVVISSGLGTVNILRRSGATIAEVVAPSLTNGCLSLKAVIEAV